MITSNKQEFENEGSDGGGGHTRLGGSQVSKVESRRMAKNQMSFGAIHVQDKMEKVKTEKKEVLPVHRY